jgi:hypothetical protein
VSHLEGVVLEDRGDLIGAEEHFRTSHELDAELAAPLFKLVEHHGDRGDARSVQTLVSQLDVDTPERNLVRMVLAGPQGVGRNDPCPCGSQRKFKTCCQSNPRQSESSRAQWLRFRWDRFTFDTQGRRQLRALALHAFGSLEQDDVNRDALTFLADVTRNEGGGLQRYVAQRGSLFDDIDSRLVENWSQSKRALYEVLSTDPGQSITVRDTKTGDTVDLSERAASKSIQPGEYFLGIVSLEDGKDILLDNPLLISLGRRESVIALLDSEPDAFAIAEWYGSLLAPPRLTNSDGHDLQFFTAHLELTTPVDLVKSTLDELFEPDGTNEWVHLDDDRTVLGSLTLQAGTDELLVTANSSERLASLTIELQDMGIE